MIARRLETIPVSGLRNVPHPVLGWLPAPGQYTASSSEFHTSVSVNSINMNDRELGAADVSARNRILALGDSHTFAVGASTPQTWPKVLEHSLFADTQAGVVMNGGVIGYSLGQYLQRYRILRDKLKPTMVIVGFSMATDLYDLVPPHRGGFIYGGNASREYFDLDAAGQLVEKVHIESQSAVQPVEHNLAQRMRAYLEGFALYRASKRSSRQSPFMLAMARPLH